MVGRGPNLTCRPQNAGLVVIAVWATTSAVVSVTTAGSRASGDAVGLKMEDVLLELGRVGRRLVMEENDLAINITLNMIASNWS